MSKICSNCNAENVDEAKFCRKCGTQFTEKIKSYESIQENNEEIGREFKDSYITRECHLEEISFSKMKTLLMKYYPDYKNTKNSETHFTLENNVSRIKMRVVEVTGRIKIKFINVKPTLHIKYIPVTIDEKALAQLDLFLKGNGMYIKNKLSNQEYIVGFQNIPTNSKIKFLNDGWVEV